MYGKTIWFSDKSLQRRGVDLIHECLCRPDPIPDQKSNFLYMYPSSGQTEEADTLFKTNTVLTGAN